MKRKILFALMLVIGLSTYSQQSEKALVEKLYNQARNYDVGMNGVTKDKNKAFELYMKAAELGHAPSQNQVADMYYIGWGTTKDESKSFYWYKRSAEQGNTYGQFNLAYYYYEGRGVKKDDSKALELFLPLAGKGDKFAMYFIGRLYEDGQGTEIDKSKALAWYMRAVKMGEKDSKKHVKRLVAQGVKPVTLRLVNGIYVDTEETTSQATNEVKEVKDFANINNTDLELPLNGHSDVDVDIPQNLEPSENTYAVIIANENYISEEKVEYAINDGRTFKEYCRKTLGLPNQNIYYCENSTKSNLIMAIEWIINKAKASGSNGKIIFYYAGHGIPDEKTNTGYLLPVDGKGSNISTGYNLKDLYRHLAELPVNSVTLFMDACFSGAKRGEGMLVSARGVAIKVKSNMPTGKLVALSATQGDETAYPYKEKEHGMFTYFLLKKLKETNGGCSLFELGDYVIQQVKRNSLRVNRKSQTPTISASPTLGDTWRNMKLK